MSHLAAESMATELHMTCVSVHVQLCCHVHVHENLTDWFTVSHHLLLPATGGQWTAQLWCDSIGREGGRSGGETLQCVDKNCCSACAPRVVSPPPSSDRKSVV